MILQLDPPIWLETPKGQGLAHLVIDRGPEHDLEWVVLHENGEVWCVDTPRVRACKNWTLNRTNTTPVERQAKED